MATSILPNAGLGLFATDSFSKGELVAEYYGSVTTAKHSESSVFDSEDKMVQADQQYCLISRGPASRANDIVDFRPADYLSACFQEYRANRRLPVIKGAAHNAKLSMESRQKVFIKATRNIAAGEEILIDYGFDYWFFFYQQCNPNRDLPIWWWLLYIMSEEHAVVRPLFHYTYRHEGVILDQQYNYQGNLLAACNSNGEILFYSAETEEQNREPLYSSDRKRGTDRKNAAVLKIAWSLPIFGYFASASISREVDLFTCSKSAITEVVCRKMEYIPLALAFCPIESEALLAVGLSDGSIAILND